MTLCWVPRRLSPSCQFRDRAAASDAFQDPMTSRENPLMLLPITDRKT